MEKRSKCIKGKKTEERATLARGEWGRVKSKAGGGVGFEMHFGLFAHLRTPSWALTG